VFGVAEANSAASSGTTCFSQDSSQPRKGVETRSDPNPYSLPLLEAFSLHVGIQQNQYPILDAVL